VHGALQAPIGVRHALSIRSHRRSRPPPAARRALTASGPGFRRSRRAHPAASPCASAHGVGLRRPWRGCGAPPAVPVIPAAPVPRSPSPAGPSCGRAVPRAHRRPPPRGTPKTASARTAGSRTAARAGRRSPCGSGGGPCGAPQRGRGAPRRTGGLPLRAARGVASAPWAALGS